MSQPAPPAGSGSPSAPAGSAFPSAFALVDTHAHLCGEELAGQADALVAAAAAAGVRQVISIATDARTAGVAVQQADRFPGVVAATAGVHPHQSAEATDADLAEIERLAADPRVVAVGEIGVDYHYEFSPRDVQHRVFARMVRLGGRVGKPLVIHCRGKTLSDKPGAKVVDPSCFADTLRLLDENLSAGQTGVFHCFEGTPGQADEILRRGFLVSFTGSLTFKSNEPIRKTAAGLPRDRVMVETDAPFMSPEPHRKVRPCTPAMVAYTASKLAELWGVSPSEAAAITTANARRLFGLAAG
jgi:TatD DNase family protein